MLEEKEIVDSIPTYTQIILTITVVYTTPLKNNPRNLCKAQVKLFSCSLDIKTKATEKVKPVDVTPTISSSGSLYLLVL